MRLLILIATIAALTACSSRTADVNHDPVKQFAMHGQVVRLDPKGKIATIKAQKIEGWMEAMTMEYPVKAEQDFSALHPNDCIDATLFVQGPDYWVAGVKPATSPAGMCVAAPAGAKEPAKQP
ncbi:MAG TPA: copper-binding protein [Bryobacteraceae bacterium]|nr:copper-binding protein [Bryobacteraceae bacterium]